MKKLLKKAIQALRNLRSWRSHVWKAKSDFHIPFFTKIKYARHDFTVNEIVWFDLEHNNYKEYISDYERVKSREINGEYKIVLDNKLLYEEIFRNYFRVPQNYAWISDGIVYGLHGNSVNNDNLIPFLKEKAPVVLKKEFGYEGKDIYMIQCSEDGTLTVNGNVKNDSEVLKLFNKGTSILTEYIVQSQFAASLYSETTNTLRIVCAKKKGEREVRIIKAAQRIGDEMSKPVDNVSAGAIVCMIDIETGELGQGVIAKTHTGNDKNKFFDCHPDTGVQLSNKVIPRWESLKNQLINATNNFPCLNLVAWDVVLTEDGFCVLEGNASAGCVMFQMEHGIRNEEMGDIYRSYGIIK